MERIDAEGITGQDAVEALTFLADFHKASTRLVAHAATCLWQFVVVLVLHMLLWQTAAQLPAETI